MNTKVLFQCPTCSAEKTGEVLSYKYKAGKYFLRFVKCLDCFQTTKQTINLMHPARPKKLFQKEGGSHD